MSTPINSIPFEIQRSPASKLNTDVDPMELSGGDYTDRVNVEFNNDSEMFSDTPTNGNKLATSIDEQVLQKQVTRIFLDPLFTEITITLKNINGQTIGTGTASSVADLLTNKNTIVSVFSGFVTAQTFSNATNTVPYIDVRVETGYSQFVLELTNQDGQPIDQTEIFEAVSLSGTGTFNEIGSLQLNDVTFIYSTTLNETFQKLTDVSFISRVGSAILINSPSHGLVTNQSIVISNATGDGANANGEWTITVVDTDNFALNFSVAGGINIFPTNYGGEIYINPYGLGQIGVQEYQADLDRYIYTKLIASRRFNFTTKKQADVTGEVNNNGYLMKFTDNYNVPRTFKYEGRFIENGALEVFNPDNGFYRYDTLTENIRNLVNYSQAEVEYSEQIQTGGSVPSGNWLYGVRFITDSGSETELSLLSLPIPVFSPVYLVNTDKVYGNVVGDNTTGKINRVRVTGITPGRFQFIELVGFNYGNSIANTVAAVGYRIRREGLDPSQTEIILEHNGNEVDTVFFDATLGNSVRPDILRVGSNRIIDNRLVYGNVTTSTSIDIRPWVDTFKYSIKRFPLFGSFGAETFYEFYDPSNTRYAGYQKWEWYRIYVAAETKTGVISDAVFAFDVRFVTQGDYDPNEFIETNKTDRRDFNGDEFVDYSLGNDRDLYQLYLEVKNVDWGYRIDGIAVSDLFRSIKIVRAERIDEVIADGSIVLSQREQPQIQSPENWLRDYSLANIVPNVVGANELSVFDYSDSFNTSTTTRKFFSFYSPDIIFGNRTYNFIPGDEIINFGSLRVASTQNYFNPFQNAWRIWKPNNEGVTSPQRVRIVNAINTDIGSISAIGTFVYFKDANILGQSGTTNSLMQGSPVIEAELPLLNQNSFTDSGQYYGLIFRRRVNKYGDRDAIGNNLIFTGSTIEVGETWGNVFGGDVFVQQFHFRHIKSKTDNSTSPSRAFNIISSNRVNANLRAYDPDNPTLAFPVNPPLFTSWLATITEDNFTKNSGYSIFNNIQSFPVYDAFSKDRGLYPTRKYWSQLSPNNSQIDRYREILPLDFQDSPNVYGEITHLEVINGELFTFQRNMFSREYFNQTGQLQTSADGTINIGDGSVLARDGARNTRRGTNHKWSVVVGYSESGRDVCYWVDTTTASVMRYGNDGSVNLTERSMFSTWFRNNIRFASDELAPADGYGIHGIWDDIGRSYVLTCRAWDRTIREWNESTLYPIGRIVSFETEQGIPVFYTSLQITQDENPQTSTDSWQRIPFTDNRYYNVWTAVINEKKNALTHFYTFYPKIYHKQDNRYFSPSPYEGEENDIYRHRDLGANFITFYGREHEGYTEYVVNPYSNINKKFNALGYSALLKPYKIELFSQFISESGIQNRQTFMLRDTEGDMEMRENIVFVSVKNNLDELGRPDQYTEPMRGLFARLRTYFKANEKQKINRVVVNYRMGQRNVLNT
jgi:hypothetical protein